MKVFRLARGEFEYAAIVQRATAPEQLCTKGTLGAPCRNGRLNRASAQPAMIVIGPVAEEAIMRVTAEYTATFITAKPRGGAKGRKKKYK